MDLPVPIPLLPPPGGPKAEMVDPPDSMSAETVAKITHSYVHTDQSVDSIAIGLGITTREVRHTIKKYGIDRQKADVIQQLQQEELAAYSKFLRDNRVSTAEQHLRISNQINEAVEKVVKSANEMPADELQTKVKALKDVAGLFRSLAETLSASSTVGARAVALSGLQAGENGGLALATQRGKTPLVSLSFQVAPPASAERPAEVLEAQVVDLDKKETE